MPIDGLEPSQEDFQSSALPVKLYKRIKMVN